MIDQPFDKLIDSLAARTATPGGGAAAAMAACMGTALFLMVVRFSRGKKQNADREADLQRVEQLLQGHLNRLRPMAERDCRSYELVSASFGMSKDTEPQQRLRDRTIQEAMIGAMIVPEETLAMVRDVFVAMDGVVSCIGKAIVSDLASGAWLLLAAAEAALLNVRINAAFLHNREVAATTMERVNGVRQEIRRFQERIAASVDQVLQ
ncbi:MAG TPA: cyclodeaminase/cyclohydrolase family protein [Planctomycetota bacterium]|nr:cyclodeaminase/cyclohydrolase family protein [Planctomycetota bacterium]